MKTTNFYNDWHDEEKRIDALSALDKMIFQLEWHIKNGKPTRKFRIKEIKIYFEIEGGPSKLLTQLLDLRKTYQTIKNN